MRKQIRNSLRQNRKSLYESQRKEMFERGTGESRHGCQQSEQRIDVHAVNYWR